MGYNKVKMFNAHLCRKAFKKTYCYHHLRILMQAFFLAFYLVLILLHNKKRTKNKVVIVVVAVVVEVTGVVTCNVLQRGAPR